MSGSQDGLRQLKLTPASTIKPRPVHWLWTGRVALGTFALLGGREGIGKSTLAYTLIADITQGRLQGEHYGQARAVIVAAAEDPWEYVIVPRLMAAGADLTRIYRVDVVTSEGIDTELSLPRDLRGLEEQIRAVDAVLVLLDPLLSRLDAALDTHKDAEVRLALEPLTAIANRTGAAVLGLIHVNKSGSTDPLNLLMASRAFAAVARAVLFLMVDPDDEETRLLGVPKNNLGSTNLPTLTFRIEGAKVEDTDEGPIWTGRLRWSTERKQSIREILEATTETADTRTAVGEAADWLRDYLSSVGGCSESSKVKVEGKKAGHSQDSLKRARPRLKVICESGGFPRQTFWRLPPDQFSESKPSGGAAPTAPTALTAPTEDPVSAVGAVSAVSETPREAAPTAPVTSLFGEQLCNWCGDPTQHVMDGLPCCRPCERNLIAQPAYKPVAVGAS